MCVWPHQHHVADGGAVEFCAAAEPNDCLRPDESAHLFKIASGLALVLAHQAEPFIEFDEMIWTGIDHREPALRPEHARRLSEVLWCENADHEVRRIIANRPFCPQIGD